MQVKKEQVTPTKVKLTLAAEQDQLSQIKHAVLTEMAKTAKIQGFRPGKAPLNMVEQSADQAALQSQVMERAINDLYFEAVSQDRLRPVAQPQIAITKFVPFTELEITAEVEVVGDIKLPDYKKIKLAKPAVKVTAKDVDEVVDSLRQRMAEKTEVKRAAKTGDEVVLDFKGTDAKTGEAIQGADATDYELALGSASFIPGFEEELIGLKAGDSKSFKITFPGDYGVAALQAKPVNFDVTIKKVSELKLPKADDAMAKQAGPFKSLTELKADIKKQLANEKQQQADREYEDELLKQIAAKTKVAIPEVLIDEEIDRQMQQLKQNLVYRGQTWQDYLKSENLTEDKYRKQEKTAAQERVTAGLALSQIAEDENIQVAPEEVSIRQQVYKGQYQDPQMQAELDKPEARREIANKLLSEKTIAKLTDYASK